MRYTKETQSRWHRWKQIQVNFTFILYFLLSVSQNFHTPSQTLLRVLQVWQVLSILPFLTKCWFFIVKYIVAFGQQIQLPLFANVLRYLMGTWNIIKLKFWSFLTGKNGFVCKIYRSKSLGFEQKTVLDKYSIKRVFEFILHELHCKYFHCLLVQTYATSTVQLVCWTFPGFGRCNNAVH